MTKSDRNLIDIDDAELIVFWAAQRLFRLARKLRQKHLAGGRPPESIAAYRAELLIGSMAIEAQMAEKFAAMARTGRDA